MTSYVYQNYSAAKSARICFAVPERLLFINVHEHLGSRFYISQQGLISKQPGTALTVNSWRLRRCCSFCVMFSVACLFSSEHRHCGVMFCFVVDFLRIGFIKHCHCCLLAFPLLNGSCPHVVRLPWQHCCEADNYKAEGISPQTSSHN